jgi:hypothetical protein
MSLEPAPVVMRVGVQLLAQGQVWRGNSAPCHQQQKQRPEWLALPLGKFLRGRPLSVQDGAAEARQVDTSPLVGQSH